MFVSNAIMKLISSRWSARGEELHVVDAVLKLPDQIASILRCVFDRLNDETNTLGFVQIKALKRLENTTDKNRFNGLGHTI
jgi:hypothetical protein